MYHTFEYPAPTRETSDPLPDTLMVYRFLLDQSVDPQYLVTTHKKGSRETMVFQRWARNPADMIAALTQRDIEGEGLFEKTVDHFSSERYRYALEGKIFALGGVAEGNGPPKAFLDVEATLVDFGAPFGAQKNVMRRRYRIEAPCKDSAPVSLIQALNETVREFSSRLRRDIKAVLKKERVFPERSLESADRA
jgi:hypothetical protein